MSRELPPITLTVTDPVAFNPCPVFSRCSAPLCPLDEEVGERTQYADEPTCRFVLNGLKKQWTRIPKGISVEAVRKLVPLIRLDVNTR